MSSVKFTPFASALKASISKMNAMISEMDKKVDNFAESVLGIVVDYDSDFFANSANADQDRADMKASIIDLFKMFQPEKKSSISGYIVYCQEERSNIKSRNPELNPTQITSALGAEWKALDDDEKSKYNEKAKSMKPMTDEEKAAKKSASKKSSTAKVAQPGKVVEKKEEKKVENKNKSASKKKEEPKTPKASESGKKKAVEPVEPKTPKKSAVASPKTKEVKDIFAGPAKKITENPEFWACKRINLDENTEGRRWKYHPETGLCFENNDTYTLVATYIDDVLTWMPNVPDRIKNWAVKCGCNIPEDEEEDIELEGEFSDEE